MIRKPRISSITLPLLLILPLMLLLPGSVSALAQQLPLPPGAQPAPQRESAPKESRETERRADDYRPPRVVVDPDEDYRIGAGDVIEIRVADAEELSGTRRVRADGTIRMPFLGRMLVLDKTPEDLAKMITDGLAGKYLFDPRVDVNVVEYNSRMIWIQGAVGRPGVYQMEGNPDLLQLIVLAGGLQQNYGSTAYIIRRVKLNDEERRAQEAVLKEEKKEESQQASQQASSQGSTQGSTQASSHASGDQSSDEPRLKDSELLARQYTLIKLNINGLMKGNFEQNMFLKPGDIVTIPPTDMFFVTGQVKAPGSFQLKDGTSLRQAIALAQGFTPTASPGKGIIFRENPETGKRLELKVDLGAVMSGKQDDMLIYPNDVIVVPQSGLKAVAMPALNLATISVLSTLLLRVFY